ncbi:MAG: CRISPR-associated protein [Elainella sp.]
MRTSLTRSLKIFFSPETILPFLLSSVCLAIFGNAIYDILKNSFGTETPALVRLAVITLLILTAAIALFTWGVAQRFSRIPQVLPFEIRQKQLDQQYRGLILLVSQFEACETAIRFHLPRLNRCWLICSKERLEIAQEVRRQYPSVCVDAPILVNDVYNPLEFRDRIDEIYRDRLPASWPESDVIADYTGMTAHASVGTVLACTGTNRPLQYTPAKLNDQGRIVGSLAPIRVLLKPDEIKIK